MQNEKRKMKTAKRGKVRSSSAALLVAPGGDDGLSENAAELIGLVDNFFEANLGEQLCFDNHAEPHV